MKFIRLLSAVAALVFIRTCLAADAELVASPATPGDFPLVSHQSAAPLLIEASTSQQVARAAEDLRSDIERVTGIKPALQHEFSTPRARTIVIAGVVGQSPLLAQLVADGKLDVSTLTGAWESFAIAVVGKPFVGVDQALVIAGSDPRGAMYGIYEVSESIGVSPWAWWADVPVKKHASLAIRAGVHRQGPPAVKYRGIFLNDEDWGLQPWAAKTFEPETGDIGPKTYAKIFELLLRLRANTCWPAMHPSTRAFNHYPGDKLVADQYGIVMGSSHAEPMLRNNVDEWPHDRPADYNYVTNREGVLKYWEDRVKENGKFENLYTMGMRGVHDSGMPGGGTVDEKAARLTRIISDQRELLKKWVNPDPAKVPQIFCPYKEVLDIYRHMPVPPPEDITLVWPDDNWGYVRQFSNEQERRRSGGAGVYYHISYWGAPYDYLWLCSTPPALIWEEMTKAYDYGANRVWIVNVGDIKPGEIGMEFFLKLAWNPHRWTAENAQQEFLQEIVTRDFGWENAGEIAGILGEYYRLNFVRKPEHTGIDPKKPLLAKSVFLSRAHDVEMNRRLVMFKLLEVRATSVSERLELLEQGHAIEGTKSPGLLDAYYQRVLYPVRCAALMNEKGIYLSRYYATAETDPVIAATALVRARTAHEAIQQETRRYNESMSGGKWRNIMSAAPRGLPVFEFPNLTPAASPDLHAMLHGVEPTPLPQRDADFVERDGRIVLEAEHASTRAAGADAQWQTLNGVGYNGASVLISPVTAASKETPEKIQSEAPRLEFKLWLETGGEIKALVRTLPTWAIVAGHPQRYAIALDDAAPQIVPLPTYTEETNPTWQRDVLRNAAVTTSTHRVAAAGPHTLKFWMVDPGIVLDTLMVEHDGAPDAGYSWPDETRATK